MKPKHLSPNFEGVANVIDGRTGNVLTPEEYKRYQRGQREAHIRERFIKGPIPVPWMAKAFSLTPSAGRCAVALFYQRGLCRKDKFKIEPARFLELGIDETARRRGLRELESAGIIRCQKQTSKTPVVELIQLS